MLELICQQRYRAAGIPTDLSLYRNHGTGIQTSAAPGRLPGQSAIQFPATASRVDIQADPKRGWAPLQQVKVEVVARIALRAQRTQMLVSSDSFQLSILETALTLSVATPFGSRLSLRGGVAGSPGVPKSHTVPDQTWTTLGFHHDGFSRCQLFIDGIMIAETSANSGVGGLQGGVICIGNESGGGSPLQGEIDEVRIWRSDPHSMKREFLCRPHTKKTADCFEAYLRKLQQWAAENPAAFQAAMAALASGSALQMRALLQLPAAEQEQARLISDEYLRLWCKGEIHGSAMEHVIHRWITFLLKHNIDEPAQFSEAEAAFAHGGLHHDPKNLHCDPTWQAFYSLLQREYEKAKAGRA